MKKLLYILLIFSVNICYSQGVIEIKNTITNTSGDGVIIISNDYQADTTKLGLIISGWETQLHTWYDGLDTTTVIEISGKTSQWTDKTGNEHDALNADAAKRPTYVSNRMRFTRGSGTYLQTAAFSTELSQPNTIFILMQYKNIAYVSSTMRSFDGLTATKRQMFWEVASQKRSYAGASIINGSSDTLLHLHSSNFNGAASNYIVDGVKVEDTAGSYSLDGITLGASYALGSAAEVDIFEVLVFDDTLTSVQIDLIEDYFIDRWDLSGWTAYLGSGSVDNLAYLDDTILYAVQKFDNGGQDIITVFDRELSNGVWNFYKQGFNDNQTSVPVQDYTIDTLIMWARSDNVGP